MLAFQKGDKVMNEDKLALLMMLVASIVTASFHRLTGGKAASKSLSLSVAILFAATCVLYFRWIATAFPVVSVCYGRGAGLLTFVAVSELFNLQCNSSLSF